MPRKLSEHLISLRADRPDEWLMDEFAREAARLEAIEEKFNSAHSPTNSDYTVALLATINGWNTAEDLHINEKCLLELATRLNVALQKQHCA